MELSPKEKAKELVEKFRGLVHSGVDDLEITSNENAKKCALIYVKGMRDMAESIWEKMDDYHTAEYWDEIKQEIEKL